MKSAPLGVTDRHQIGRAIYGFLRYTSTQNVSLMEPECHRRARLQRRACCGIGVMRQHYARWPAPRTAKTQFVPGHFFPAALLLLGLVLSACSRKDAAPQVPAVAAAPAYESPTMPAQVTPFITPIPTATNTPTPLPTATPDGYWPESAEQIAAHSLLGEQSGVYGFVVMEADGHIVSSYNSRTPAIRN